MSHPPGREALPIDPLLDSIIAALPPGGTLLLQAPPGAGKTTRVPLALLDHLQSGSSSDRHTILMLEPRRLAAKAAAERLAAHRGEALGALVGYRVRLEQRVSPATRIEVVTDGLFLRRLQADPSLEGVACVIIDEFHERRAEADLALALLREARSILAPELRLVVMSATMDLPVMAERLGDAQVIRSEGRSFPVTVAHQRPREREAIAAQVVRALEEHWLPQRAASETVLVFLPGQREIRQTSEALADRDWARAVEVVALHGDLPLAAQRRAIARATGGGGKVVLATSLAESSLTIEGVSLVIDSGLSRRSRFSPRTGMDALVTVPASQASAEQRRGRAGRLAPGRCVRLWSPAEVQRRPAFDPPELLECDPAPLVLQLAQWGAGLGEDLPWLDRPPDASLQEGRALLRQLGALDDRHGLTEHGRAMARLGVHPRLAHMLLKSHAGGHPELGCALAVLLSERDPLERHQEGCDLIRRLDWLRRDDDDPRRRAYKELQRKLQQQVNEAVPGTSSASTRSSARRSTPAEERALAATLVASAYPERVARVRGPGSPRYLMRGGQGAQLHPTDPLVGCEALAIAAVDGGSAAQEARILSALPLGAQALDELLEDEGEQVTCIVWDRREERVRCTLERRLGSLRLESRPWPDPPEEEVAACLIEGLQERGLQVLPWTPTRRQLQHRLTLAHRWLGAPWPDRSDGALANDLEIWLADHLVGLRSLADLAGLPLEEALWSGIPWNLRAELERLLPQQVPIASGRLARLDYGSGEPVLAVKLQELFGSGSGPCVLDGRLPVTVHLLSPAGRPVQITRDLAGFWKGSYAQVRQELRGRYPKHPWPEDPLQAPATALTKRRAASLSP